MEFQLMFIALITLVLGLTTLQQVNSGQNGPRQSAIITFIGCALLSAAIVLGILGYLLLQFDSTGY